jgi:hypothetical protein
MPAATWSTTWNGDALARFGGLFYCSAVGPARKDGRGAAVAVAASETVSEAAING